MEAAYAAAGVAGFAAWVHERDAPMRRELEGRGYALQETTRAMGMALSDLRVPRPELDLATPDWSEYLRVLGVPPGLLTGVDPRDFHVLIARAGQRSAATGMAY